MPEGIESYRRAGKIAREIREEARKFISPEKKLLDVAVFIESRIIEKNGKPAFPCNLGLNSIGAHYTPDMEDTVIGKNVIKVDFGVQVDGYIADTAFTLDFSGNYKEMIESSEEALKKAIELARPGICIKEIGQAIQGTINSYGFRPIANLSGHLLERYNLHAGISIPNVPKGEDILKENMVFAIEPFSTNGDGWVNETEESRIFRFLEYKPVRMPEARKILELADKKFEKLPFAKRWVEMPSVKKDLALIQLLKANALYRYPVLKERGDGIITQAEHTVIVKDKPEVIT